MDPVLRRRGYDYGWHLSDLYQRGITEFGDPGKDVCMGMFFVKRKDDLIRMIVSPDVSNKLCEAPPYCPLPSSSALAELSVEPGEKLYKASGDVDTCFFQYSAPPKLRWLFGLPGICKKVSATGHS